MPAPRYAALEAAYASYDDRNTLWMHSQGRITLNPEDVLRLENEAARKERWDGQTDSHIALGDLAAVETVEVDPNIVLFMQFEDLVDEKTRAKASSNPHNKISAWQDKDKVKFFAASMTHAIDLCDGSSDPSYDMQIRRFRRFNDTGLLLPTIQISRIETPGSFIGGCGIPSLEESPPWVTPDQVRVAYTLLPGGCTAQTQPIRIIRKKETRWKDPKVTVKDRGEFSGNYPINNDMLTDLLADVKRLRPRAGRVWQALA